MTTLIQRLRLMHDEDGVRKVQRLLDEHADALWKASAFLSEMNSLRRALRNLLDAQSAGTASDLLKARAFAEQALVKYRIRPLPDDALLGQKESDDAHSLRS